MSKIIIIGAGAMGSAFALPCLDNKHDINIVGTHLENDFIDDLKKGMNQVILGQDELISKIIISILSNGHIERFISFRLKLKI